MFEGYVEYEVVKEWVIGVLVGELFELIWDE